MAGMIGNMAGNMMGGEKGSEKFKGDQSMGSNDRLQQMMSQQQPQQQQPPQGQSFEDFMKAMMGGQ